MPQVMLDNLTVDYEQFRQQFFSDLLTRDNWADLAPSAIGVTISEWIASLGAYETMAIERALQETMLDTARQPNSIYTIARMLGIHLYRRKPGWATAQFFNNDPYPAVLVPAYSQLTVNGRGYFNRDAMVFNYGDPTPQTITVYEGIVGSETIVAQGGDFQRYYIGATDLYVSDDDIICMVNGTTLLNKTIEGMWKLKYQETAFFENTLPDKRIEIVFGNNNYGYTPKTNDQLIFTYTTTSGSNGNYAVSGENVTVLAAPTVGGITLTSTVGGQDEKSLNFYKVFGPSLFSANTRMVTREDYRAVTLTYNTVIDCSYRGQADIDPNRVEWMNTIEYTILSDPTQPSWTDAQHATFLEWVKTKGIYQTRMQRRDPTIIELTVEATIYCRARANLLLVQETIIEALISFFKVHPGSLGFSVYRSDIITVIQNADTSIQFVELQSPKLDFIITYTQYVLLNKTNLSQNIVMQYTDRTTTSH